MKFAMLFSLNVIGRRKGSSRISTSKFWEVAEMDIPDLDDDQAPVAISWTETLPYPVDGVFNPDRRIHLNVPSPEHGERHTRFHEGSHFSVVGQFPGVPWDDYEAILENLGSPGRSGRLIEELGGKTGETDWNASRLRDIERYGNDARSLFDRVDDTNGAWMKDKLRIRASEFIAVAGVLYRRCAEPSILVTVSPVTIPEVADDEAAVIRVVVQENPNERTRLIDDRRYSMAQADEAMAVARAFNVGGTRLLPMVNALNDAVRPVVHDPASLDGRLYAFRKMQDIMAAVFRTTAHMDHGLFPKNVVKGLNKLADADGMRMWPSVFDFAEDAFAFLAAHTPPGSGLDRVRALAIEGLELLEGRNVSLDDIALDHGRAMRP